MILISLYLPPSSKRCDICSNQDSAALRLKSSQQDRASQLTQSKTPFPPYFVFLFAQWHQIHVSRILHTASYDELKSGRTLHCGKKIVDLQIISITLHRTKFLLIYNYVLKFSCSTKTKNLYAYLYSLSLLKITVCTVLQFCLH